MYYGWRFRGWSVDWLKVDLLGFGVCFDALGIVVPGALCVTDVWVLWDRLVLYA